jgi:hypothetical protein
MKDSPQPQNTKKNQPRKKNFIPKPKQKRNPFPAREVTAYKAYQAHALAERLLESPETQVDEKTGEVTDHPARYFAGLLCMEGDGMNHVTALLRSNDTTYEQGIPLSRGSLRISPAYSQALRRRAHRLAEAAIDRAEDTLSNHEKWGKKKRYDWSYRWVHGIFTMAHLGGSITFPEVGRFNRAWELFRKRECFQNNVIAAIKGIEGRVSYKGAHVHGHVMMLMRRVDADEWDRNWRECLSGDPDEPAGWIRLMTIRPAGKINDPDQEETQGQAVDEICKYITKTEDLLEPDPETGKVVPWEVLCGLCTPKRWPRMFERLGTARPPRVDRNAETLALEPDEFSPGRSPGFRFIRREYLTAGPEDVEPWDPVEDGPEPYKWDYYGKKKRKGPERAPTWRQLMTILDLDAWLKVIGARWKRAQKWRLGQIFARAVGQIIDLDGNIRVPDPAFAE